MVQSLVSKQTICVAALGCAVFLLSEDTKAEPLDEIIVEGHGISASPPVKVGDTSFTVIKPQSLGEGLQFLPGTAISTNSRGEQVFSVRGRSERDVTVVLGDFVLRDPWDGRFDMARLPGGAFGGADIAPEGNALRGLGSVVALKPLPLTAPFAEVAVGDFGQARGSAAIGTEQKYLFTDYATRDGQPVPGDAALPFSQADLKSRTNSYQERASVLGYAAWDYREIEVSALGLGAFADYGVVPEGHLDPAVDRVRYWQIPEDHRWIGGVSARKAQGQWSWHVASTVHSARRKIESFTDETYTLLTEEERGQSLGSRTELGGQYGDEKRGLAVNASWNREQHREKSGTDPEDQFRRHTYALAAQTYYHLRGDTQLRGGLRVEGFDTAQSGGRPQGSDQGSWSGNAAINYQYSPSWSFEAVAARLARLPTQRELYGEALDRFVPNEDLREEVSVTFSLTATRTATRYSFSLKPFVEERQAPITQTIISSNGGNQRQRVNGENTLALGLDGRLRSQIMQDLDLELNFSFLSIEEQGTGDPVPEQPNRSISLVASYRPIIGPQASILAVHRGTAFSLNEDGDFSKLTAATEIGIDVGYRWRRHTHALELFGRLQNATDTEVLPQLGLPGPGRRLEVGLKISGA